MEKVKSSENRHVFIWKDFKEWKSALESMFKDILTPELKAKLKKNREIVEYCDNQTECEEFIGKSFDSIINYQKIDEFRKQYSHIRTYHACRPVDIDSYYQKGILLLCKDEQVERFRTIFLNGTFTELTEKNFRCVLKELLHIR